jgi:hypothetical protein
MTADLGGLLLVNLLWLAAGAGVTHVAGWWRGRGIVASLGVVYLAGVAAYGVVAQLLFVLGLSLGRAEIVLVCAVLAAGVAVGRGGRPARLPRPGLPAAAVAAVLVVLAIDLWFQPLWAYDAWTFWTPKAHALAALGGLDASWFSQPELLNRDYPILLPAVEAAGFRFTGYETGLLDLQSLLFVVALMGAFAQIVRVRAPRWSWVIALLVVLAPSLADQLASSEADVPLACFYACAAACAYLWHRERTPGSLALFGLFCAGAVATKAEGLPYVAALVVVAAALEAGRGAGAVAGVGVAGAAAGLLPWRLWVDDHGIPQQASFARSADLAGRVGRATLSVRYLAERLLDPRAWLLLVPLLAALTVLAALRGRRRDALAVAARVLLCVAAIVFAYWTSRFEIHYHLATSARRVVTAPILAWAFLVPLLWSREQP